MRFLLFSIPLLALAASASHDQAGAPRGAAKRHHGHGRRASGGVKRQPSEPVDVSFSNATSSSDLTKRQAFHGRGTFYYTGLGACGQYSNDGDYMVALNSAQYGGGYPGPQCFKYITVQANGVTVGGVQILDECPTCGWGDLDLSPGLFKRFADEGAGVVSLTWWFDGSNPQPQPSSTTTTTQAPTTTWTPPTTTWQPPSTTQAPPSSSTTTTTQAPPSTSSTTTTTAAPSSSVTSLSASASNSTRISASATNTTNPFAVVASINATMTSVSATASASASAGAGGATVDLTSAGNFVMLNGVVTNYGQIIVSGAGGSAARI